MKQSGRVIMTAMLTAAVAIGCNDKNAKDNDMTNHKKNKNRIFRVQEPVCIYGPPEMLGAFDNISDEPEPDLPVSEDLTEDNVSDKGNTDNARH